MKTSFQHTIRPNSLCRSLSSFRALAACPIESSNPSIEITIYVDVLLSTSSSDCSFFFSSMDPPTTALTARVIVAAAAASSSLRSTGVSNVVQSDLQGSHSSSLETTEGSSSALSLRRSLSTSAFQMIKRVEQISSFLISRRHLSLKLANVIE